MSKMQVGPGSYNSHVVLDNLLKSPCTSVIHFNHNQIKGAGNYIMVGQSIVLDSEMIKKFPGGLDRSPLK